jgi:hypothetical protein
MFYGAIIDWATSKGKGLEFWWSGDSMRSTIILRAIRAIWGKEKCQMDMLYDYEKNFEDTYYIPVTLLTCMQEHFPVLMWAELFRISPKFAYLHGPPKIVLAIELCMQGDPSPWKNAQLAIEDGTRPLPVANEPHQAPHQAKGSKKRSKPDSRSETATWLDVSPWQEWSTSERTWGGWISFPSTGLGSGWWDDCGTDASSREATSSISEEHSRGGWGTEGYGQSRHRSAASRERTDSVTPPWHFKKR